MEMETVRKRTKSRQSFAQLLLDASFGMTFFCVYIYLKTLYQFYNA